MPISSSIGIGRSALLAHQGAIRTVSENISNVETEGYARRRVEFEADPSGGVRIGVVERIVDRFLESRLIETSGERSGAQARADLLERVEGMLPLGESSLAGALDRFFDAAGELAAHPEDLAVRRNLLERAEALAAGVRALAGGLEALQHEADQRVSDEVAVLNERLAEVARLNRDMPAAGETGGSALADRRDHLLAEIGERIAIRSVLQEDGTVDVALRDSGVALVTGSDAARLLTRISTTPALDGGTLHEVAVALAGGQSAGLPGSLGGRLGGLLAVRDDDLPAFAAEVDALALALRDAVNAVQTNATASDLDGAPGLPFFTGSGGADLSVALSNPRGIAAALGATVSDNRNALALVDLRLATIPSLGGVSLSESAAALAGNAGAALRQARDTGDVADSLHAALRAQRDSVSAVSLDEELTDLVRFQRGFQAAAQLIRAGDSLLEELLGVVR